MDYTITFTIQQLWGTVLGICAGVACISGAVTVVINIISKAKAPEKKQDERLTSLEERIAEHDKLLSSDNARLKALEDGNVVTQRALLALLAHGIDGNAFDEMRKAKQELNEYLLTKK